MSGFNCCLLTYIQVSQETGKVVWFSHHFGNFPQFVVIHTVKAFIIVNEGVVEVFLEFPCYLYDLTNVGNLISDSSTFSKSNLNICKFSVYILLKSSLEKFEYYFLIACDMSATVWQFEHSLGLERKLTFSSPVTTAEFSKFAIILSATLSEHHLLGFEIAQLEFHHLP